MSDVDRGQVIASAAEIYDSFFVPALFEQWTDAVLDDADVRHGHRVLDVGCGTGVLARAAAGRAGGPAQVAAVDPNEGMLEVARRSDPSIEWRTGAAERLPFADRSFDRTISQFALMFCTDPIAAVAEVARVTDPAGRIALAVWDRFEHNVGYARLATLVEQLFGGRAARALRVPFEMGEPGVLARIASHGVVEPHVKNHRGTARFGSLEAWLHTEIRGWTLADVIDDGGFAALVEAAHRELGDLTSASGVAFEVSALVVSGAPAS